MSTPARQAAMSRPALIALSALLAWPAVAPSQEAPGFRVEAEGPARVFLPAEGDEADPVLEASAVQPIGAGRLWLVAHDKAPGLVVVDSQTGRRVGGPLTASGFPSKGEKDGPKWEGMARDDEGNYYAIGSHSGKAAEREERSVLIRFRLDGDGSDGRPVAIEPDSVVRLHVADALKAALEGCGLDAGAVEKRKVEGLAVRTTREPQGTVVRRELVIGLREPDDRVRVFAADITEPPAHGAKLDLHPFFCFEPGEAAGVPMTLTSLEHHPDLGGFLVITATEDEANVFHGNILWLIPDAEAPAAPASGTFREVRPVRLLDFEPAMKAEGIAVLAPPARPGAPIRLAVVFDNDPLKTRIPSRLQVLRLIPSSPRP